MPNVTVELGWETVDNIVLGQLQEAYSGLVTDLEEREGTGRRGGIFDSDKDKDIMLIKAHIAAFECVIKYFGGNLDR
jgi:hypothetical protein